MESYSTDKTSLTQLWKNSSLSMGERRRRSFASIGDTAKLEKETKEKERRLTEIRTAVAAEREIFERLRKEAVAKGSWLKSGLKNVVEKEVPSKQQPKNFKPQSTTNMLKSRNYNPLIPPSSKILTSQNKQIEVVPKHNNPTQIHRARESGYEFMAMDVEEIPKHNNTMQIPRARESGHELMDTDGDILHTTQSKQNISILQDIDIHQQTRANLTTMQTPKDSTSSSSDQGFQALESIPKHNNYPSYDFSELISINRDITLPSNIQSAYELKPKNEKTYEAMPESHTNVMAISSQSESSHLQRPRVKPLSISMVNAIKSRDFDEVASHESFRKAVVAWRNANGSEDGKTMTGSKKVFDTLGCQTESPNARQIELELDPPLTQRGSYFYHLLFQFPNHAPFVKSMTQVEEEKRLLASSS